MATMGASQLGTQAGAEQGPSARLGRWARLRRYGLSRRQLGWLLFLPSVIVLLGVLAYPAGRTVYLSLHTSRLDEPWLGTPFVGLKNFSFILQQQDFWQSMRVSAYFTVGSVLAELLLGLVVALVVNEAFRGRGLMRAAMLVPWAIPAVISARMFGWMYSPSVGAFNGLLNSLHIYSGPIDFLSSDTWAMPAVILADVWKNTPFVSLLLLAGLQIIPAELYESARVDGAGVLDRFRHITLPLLRGSIVIALLFRTITAFQTFDLPFTLTQGGPGTDTELLSLHAYRTLFSYVNFGRGSAMAVILAVICFFIAAIFARQLTIEEF
ncbi:MAG: binding-protein-dependent transport system inner rane component [Chloroflexi bacterium]|nr:binding-protein-dependent transport system inner rane component [Chloroflexota bacterium]